MMPLLDENRSLVKKAFTFMKEENYPSLELLLGNQQNYNITTIGFTIAPKINSFGRLPEYCHPNVLVKYFLKNASRDLMMKVSTVATQINNKRQSLTNEQYAYAMKEMNESFLYYASEDVHEGLVGLIAGKYTRQYEKPSFVMHYDKGQGIYKGSARSVEGFSLHEFFTNHQEQFVAFGGHAMAGGFSVDEEHFDSLHHCITAALENIELHSSTNVLVIDESDLSIENIESLELLEPFGMCNEEPLYLLTNVPISHIYSLSEGKHLKLDIEFSRVKLSALFFNKGHLLDKLQKRQNVNLVGTLSINEFRNQKNMNFIIKDII